jgi:hypothetical protein
MIHFGNIHDIETAFILGREVMSRGADYHLNVYFQDTDLTDNGRDHGPVLKYSKDPNGCHETIADHSTDLIRGFLRDLAAFFDDAFGCRINYRTFMASDMHKQKNFIRTLHRYLRIESESFILDGQAPRLLCPHCKKPRKTDYKEGGLLVASCNGSGASFRGRLSDPDKINYEFHLPYTEDIVIQTALHRPDLHVIGWDHVHRRAIKEIEQGLSVLDAIPPMYFHPTWYSRLSKTYEPKYNLQYLQERYGDDYLDVSVRLVKGLLRAGTETITALEAVRRMDAS